MNTLYCMVIKKFLYLQCKNNYKPQYELILNN